MGVDGRPTGIMRKAGETPRREANRESMVDLKLKRPQAAQRVEELVVRVMTDGQVRVLGSCGEGVLLRCSNPLGSSLSP